MLDARTHQGTFGEDYVRALAAAAGLLVYEYKPDRAGIDFGFRVPDQHEGLTPQRIEVQVKTWSRPRAVGPQWHFNGLNEQQFNQLAGECVIPRYLFVVCVPPDPAEYVDFQTEGMLLRQLGYFRSLADEPRIENPDKNRKPLVRIPLGNVLTVQSMRSLLPRVATGLGRTG